MRSLGSKPLSVSPCRGEDSGLRTKLEVVSLFSGIGGFDEGFRRAGFETVAHSEIEKFSCKIYHQHFPNSFCLGDIKEVVRTMERLSSCAPDSPVRMSASPGSEPGLQGNEAD